MHRLRGNPRTRSRPLRLVAVMIVLALVMAACGTSGRNMQAPVPGATAPPRRADPTTSTLAGQATVSSAALFTLSSAAFSPGEGVPAEFSCDDVGNAPPVSWTNLPPGTVELALVIDDPDAAGFVHWLVAKIDPATTGLGPRVAPPGAIELHNSNGTAGYAPLCPPPGDTHVYDFTLYALDRPSGLTAQSDTTAALTTLATTAVGTAVLTGSYTRKTAN